jgi:hypothetical protein
VAELPKDVTITQVCGDVALGDPRIIIIHQLFFSRSDVEWGAKGASAAAQRKEGGLMRRN